MEIIGSYYNSRGFASAVGGSPSRLPDNTNELFRRMLPEEPERQPFPTGELNSHDWRIVEQLARNGGCTILEICQGMAATLAKRSVDPQLVENRLTHLAETGGCSQETLPDGRCVWRATEDVLAVAGRFIPSLNKTSSYPKNTLR